MLHKRPLSADGGASEAKRSSRLLLDRHSPSHSDQAPEEDEEEVRQQHKREAEEEDEEMEASDMRMTSVDHGVDEEESRLRDTKRNIKLLSNSRGGGGGGHEDRPRSAQHHSLESGKYLFT